MPRLTTRLGRTQGFAYTFSITPIQSVVPGLGHSIAVDSFVEHARRPGVQRKLQITTNVGELQELHRLLGAYLAQAE